MPHMSSVPLSWRTRKSKYSLIGSRCTNCSTISFPPRAFCQKCRRRGKLEEIHLSGTGEILSFTTIRSAPKGFENQAPYIIGIVKLDEGPTTAAQIVNNEGIEIGKKVRVVFRKTYEDGGSGLLHYGFKFEVV